MKHFSIFDSFEEVIKRLFILLNRSWALELS